MNCRSCDKCRSFMRQNYINRLTLTDSKTTQDRIIFNILFLSKENNENSTEQYFWGRKPYNLAPKSASRWIFETHPDELWFLTDYHSKTSIKVGKWWLEASIQRHPLSAIWFWLALLNDTLPTYDGLTGAMMSPIPWRRSPLLWRSTRLWNWSTTFSTGVFWTWA